MTEPCKVGDRIFLGTMAFILWLYSTVPWYWFFGPLLMGWLINLFMKKRERLHRDLFLRLLKKS